MDPRLNPYTPGAGARPAVLGGRTAELSQFDILLARLAAGRSERSLLITGLRGVGKTVLLLSYRDAAEAADWAVVTAEISDDTDFPYVLAEMVREALYRVSPPAKWRDKARRAAGVLRAFALTINPDGSIALSLRDTEPVVGPADTGDLSYDAPNLLEALGEAAKENKKGVAFLIDEAQYLDKGSLSALVAAFHRISQRTLPVTLIAAGLPQLLGLAADARAYSERLFQVLQLGALEPNAARRALEEPARPLLTYDSAALDKVCEVTQGYAFFLQEFGSVLWEIIPTARAHVEVADVDEALPIVLERLDKNFFRVRTGTLTDTEARYLRAMAELPEPGPWRSGEIAKMLGLKSSADVTATRTSLISKSIIYAPRHGETAFTVPHFADYLRRTYRLEKHVPTPRARRTPKPPKS